MTPVEVYRAGPRTAPHYDTFQVEIQPTQTVLDVLHTILYDIDPTLAFRRSCRSAICGSCAMRINGRSRLACNTQAEELLKRDGYLRVEPLRNAEVIRDLAVDMRRFWRSVKAVRPSLVENPATMPGNGYKLKNESFAPLRLVADCIFCASCVAECIAVGALTRTESRGAHSRRDYPKRDDANWLRHSRFRMHAGGIVMDYRPVRITKFPPQERKY